MKKLELQCEHKLEPIYDANSRILILGTFPSVKSRNERFYYAHPQNRFWKVLSSVLKEEEPKKIEDKVKFLLTHHIALWDVIASCDIEGSSDASIRNVVPANLNQILNQAQIQKIFVNGTKAEKLYRTYCYCDTKREIIKLPSTSPANAAWSLERLIEDWGIISDAILF